MLCFLALGCVQQEIEPDETYVAPAPAVNPLLAKEVSARLASVPGLAGPYRVQADIRGDRVTLTGTAHRSYDIVQIVRRIRNIPGVSAVDNQIQATAPITDEAIQSEVLAAFERDPDLRGSGITVSVRAGVVTLRGDLPNSCLIDKALTEVAIVDGVKDFRSALTMDGKRYHPSAHCPGYQGDLDPPDDTARRRGLE